LLFTFALFASVIFSSQNKNGFRRSEEQTVASPAGNELYAVVTLSKVRLETERQSGCHIVHVELGSISRDESRRPAFAICFGSAWVKRNEKQAGDDQQNEADFGFSPNPLLVTISHNARAFELNAESGAVAIGFYTQFRLTQFFSMRTQKHI
jgi:hypothetical protein